MRRLLVTGGTGTFGRAMVRRALSSQRWDAVVTYSRDEQKAAQVTEEFGASAPFHAFLGDVRDRDRLAMAFRGVDTVVHAAALKRVDQGAYSPSELIKTNIVGTMNVVEAAIHAGVGRVVVLSSDKSVAPINLYGATKHCTTPETPILLADLTWKQAGDIRLGDSLVGVDESPAGRGAWRRLRPAAVRRISTFSAPRVKVVTNRGEIIVSADHRFLARDPKKSSRNVYWMKATSLRPGHVVKHIGQPWPDRSDSWLAGMMDGEGCLGVHARNTRVSIGQIVGPVMERIDAELTALGVDHKVERRADVAGKKPFQVATTNGIVDVLRLLGSLQPTRMRGRFGELFAGHCATGQDSDAVVELVELAGDGELVGLTTSTGTLVANGFVSHNCAETYAVQANAYGVPSGTRIAAVRYGNVLGSRGSVLGIWRRQVAAGLPATLTNTSMTRFIMTIENAVDLVEHALATMCGGEVFVPILPSAWMGDLVRAAVPDDWPIKITGLRPGGEKLAESLLNVEEPSRTLRQTDAYYLIYPTHHSWTATKPWQGTPVDPSLRYESSDGGWLSVDVLRTLIRQIGGGDA